MALGMIWMATVGCYDDRNLLTTNSATRVFEFEVRGSRGHVLWRIVSGEGPLLREYDTGVVPPGFQQEAPSPPGSPRRFRKGESVTTVTWRAKERLVHECSATGERTLRGGYWESTPRKPPSGPWAPYECARR
jgi:hypothetical protein